MQRVKLLCANNQSWKAGQFLYLSSGLLAAAASDNVNLKYLALADQSDTSTGGATYAEVGVITSDHVFEMYEHDTTVTDANKGVQYPLIVASNVCTFDTSDSTTPAFLLLDVASNYEPSRNVAADVKGRARVKVLQSVLDA